MLNIISKLITTYILNIINPGQYSFRFRRYHFRQPNQNKAMLVLRSLPPLYLPEPSYLILPLIH